MSTIAIIGAGPGLGAAVARRFGREDYGIALISRDQDRLDALAAELGEECEECEEGEQGVTARGFAADVRDPNALTAALDAAAAALGPIEVLQYSPVPHKDFMRPVLETTADDVVGPVEFSVYGPVTAVRNVLPGMRALGRGTVLFVNGGTAVVPHPDRAGTSIAFAAESAYGRLLHDTLAAEGIHVAQLIIPGAIIPGHDKKDPAILADTLWNLHQERNGFRHFADDLDS
ncbi:SDR family NAD(P)-dependent oxidoreductase [Streptomyces sp. NBS 14/10]|uniref:SDR family NAD(P)-dependent oxidoreductase n=1 Tax=Streptomyces sp. NBS 14/10 TaxID=1945643 RepID=UPI000B7F276E|nr:SDR family NAD(P)-dependent oxidoreductase [Streptomyces sp. NBS 14/10]KAK1185683.1 SDR family NAD(P)-dependent oxidoreductase [Streptomyces sp. NBS 14/10]